MRKGLAALLVSSLVCQPAFAAFDDAPFGARDAAMGGAFTAVHDEVAAIAYNPAALGHAPAVETAASYVNGLHWPAGRIDRDITRAAVAVPVRQDILNGAFGAQVRYDRIHEVSKDREIGFYYGTRGLREVENGGLDFGAGLKSLTTTPANGGGKTKPTLDFGALWRMGGKRAYGLSLLNFGGPGVGYDRAPLTLKAGAAETVRGSLLAVDATARQSSGGHGGSVSFALGFERWRATARSGAWALRSGLALGDRSRTWNWGFGWRLGGGRVDYSMSVPLTGTTRFRHGLTMALRFGRADPEAEYERLLESEVRARQELSRSLENAAIRQRTLTGEINRLREEIETLRGQLGRKGASESEARRKLIELEQRQRKAAADAAKLAAEQSKSRAELFRQEWAQYQKVKLSGAPNDALRPQVERLLSEYKDSGVDLGDAHQELRRLQQQAP